MPNLLEQLKLLPSNTIVLHTAITQDTAGNRFIDATQAVPMVAGAARAPVFVLDDVDLNNGAVGGDLLSWAATARDAVKSALRILNGEKPQDIPIIRSDNVFMFDWQALRRWGLKEADLPPASNLLNRKPTFWESFKWYVIGGFSLILVEAVLIFGLLVERAKRIRAEASLIIANGRLAKDLVENIQMTETLRKSETKFSKVFRFSPVAKTLTRLKDERCVDLNEAFEHLSGWRRDEVLGRTPAEIGIWTDPDERLRFVEELKRETHIRDHEAQFRTKSGESRTVVRSSDLVEIDGELCAMTVIADITERKQAEDALSTVSQRLIEAHEEERAWIARELHDDIIQRLVLVGVNLKGTPELLPASPAEATKMINDVCEQLDTLMDDVQTLSHRLHPSSLDLMGLVTAARGLCRETSERNGVPIDFHSHDIPQELSKETSLGLFRVLQEALQNAMKHSGARHLEVTLSAESNEIRLTVSDSGIGFDLQQAAKRGGLGLSSMQERIRLLNGTLSIDSQAGCGTTVQAKIFLNSRTMSKEA